MLRGPGWARHSRCPNSPSFPAHSGLRPDTLAARPPSARLLAFLGQTLSSGRRRPPAQLTRFSQLSGSGTRLARDQGVPAQARPRPVWSTFLKRPPGPASRQCGPSPGGRGRALPAPRPLSWSPPRHRQVRAGPSFRGEPSSSADFPFTGQELNNGFSRSPNFEKGR